MQNVRQFFFPHETETKSPKLSSPGKFYMYQTFQSVLIMVKLSLKPQWFYSPMSPDNSKHSHKKANLCYFKNYFVF